MASPPSTDVFERLNALGDPTRARLLLLLERQELTVSELCAVLQAPQSTVSRHLKALSEPGWVAPRREATRRYYRMERERLSPSMRRLWLAVREEVAASPASAQDRARLGPVLSRRRSRSAEFFSTEAGAWDRTRDDLFGGGFYLRALPGLMEPTWIVGDLGCGTGAVAESLAPFLAGVVAVDGSEEMLREARRRLAPFDHVQVLHGDLETLPLEDASLDAALLALVLHHVPDPGHALQEVSRVLRPGGRLLLIDMLPHDREELAARMGHVWLGFSEEALKAHLAVAGFESVRFTPLPAEPTASGPALFAAVALRPE